MNNKLVNEKVTNEIENNLFLKNAQETEAPIIPMALNKARLTSHVLATHESSSHKQDKQILPLKTSALSHSKFQKETETGQHQICKYYKYRECKYGQKGTGCNYSHPKICKYFIYDGNGKYGCKQTECRYYHPKICSSSWTNKTCYNESCVLSHLTGTQRNTTLIFALMGSHRLTMWLVFSRIG